MSTASRDDAPNYNRNRGAGDVYSRGTAELDKDRNELFSGYNPAKGGSGRFFDGPNLEGDGDEDVEGIKQQTRFVKQESVNSTRNALRLAREAEETGRNTLARLGEQSEKLRDTERYLNTANTHSNRAADNTAQLKQLNRSIFLPAFHRNKKPQAQAPDDSEVQYQARTRNDILNDDLPVGERLRTNQGSSRKEDRKRYQFESTGSDDEIEDEMSSNLDEISDATKRLKALGMAMGDELDHQNGYIDVIAEKTDRLDDKLRVNTDKLKKIK